MAEKNLAGQMQKNAAFPSRESGFSGMWRRIFSVYALGLELKYTLKFATQKGEEKQDFLTRARQIGYAMKRFLYLHSGRL